MSGISGDRLRSVGEGALRRVASIEEGEVLRCAADMVEAMKIEEQAHQFVQWTHRDEGTMATWTQVQEYRAECALALAGWYEAQARTAAAYKALCDAADKVAE